MAIARIEDTALAIRLRRRHGEIMICPVNTRVGIVKFGGIETEEDVDFVARRLFQLIYLVVLHERLRKVPDLGETRVF